MTYGTILMGRYQFSKNENFKNMLFFCKLNYINMFKLMWTKLVCDILVFYNKLLYLC